MNDALILADYKKVEETWMVEVDGTYSNVIRKYLIDDGMPEDSVGSILQNAARVLGYCPNPSTHEVSQKTGLVIGKVQSGKTSNFITLAALAFDNSYNTIIVFGGTKRPLVNQNSERIREYFHAVKDDVLILDTNNNLDLLNEQNIKQFIKMKKKIIIIALKSASKINFIKDSIFKYTTLSEHATLIIDDEGDEASPNTQRAKGKKSPTYSAIEGLKKELSRHCYVSVTATPQANMLLNTLDFLSPEFGVLVDPGIGYCGLDVFHGANSKFTIPIPKDESSLLDDGIPASFYKAISMFFVACAIYKTCGMKKNEKMSMLIHPSQLKADHQKVFSKVNGTIIAWRKYAENKNDIAFTPLRNRFKKAYEVYQTDGTELNGYVLPEYDTIEGEIIEALNFCKAHIINGDKVSDGADDYFSYNIYVGGTMLGRGLTLKGLTITYIIRTAKSASAVDTVQQRARWFGYKMKYLDLCRIFTVDKIIKEFREIRDHEEDLWTTVHEANLQGTRFKDIERIFVLSDDMKMTRSNVAKTRNYSFNFWNYQREFQSITEYIDNNKSILMSFRKTNNNSAEILSFGEGAPFYVIKQIPFQTVKAEILNKFIFPEGSKLNRPLIDKLASLLDQKKIISNVDVIWMRDGTTSKHLISNGSIPNYMTGRRPLDKAKPMIYAGDAYQFKKLDVIQLQVHMIEDTFNKIVSPTLALYIPDAVVEKLTNLVIRD